MILTATPFYNEMTEASEEKSTEPNLWFKLLFLCGLILFFVSCATPEKKFVYDPKANAREEIQKLETDMDRANTEQVAVFAPKSYNNAEKSLHRAIQMEKQGASNEQVLHELGTARGFFEQSKGVALRSEQALPEIATARENALIAGAPLHDRKDLNKADDQLKDVTKGFEKKTPDVSLDKKVELQKRYADLELSSIKATHLGNASTTIEDAKKIGAAKYAPRTLASAEAKLKQAEMNITTDRHNDALVTASTADANHEANKLLRVTELSKKSGKNGNEPMALGTYERDERIQALNAQRAQESLQAQRQQRQMSEQEMRLREQQARNAEAQNQQLTQAQREAASARAALESQRRIEEAYRQAQNEFTSDEADVYRQGDNLIIRMKAIQFPSGQSNLPSSAFTPLSKVRNVIQNMNAQQVVVEGHTDSTGSAKKNQEVSEKRAEVVAQYLRAQVDRRMGGSNQGVDIQSRGYGYDHPIASNKTKQGRALNRRVDIVISPSFNRETGSSGSEDQKSGSSTQDRSGSSMDRSGSSSDEQQKASGE